MLLVIISVRQRTSKCASIEGYRELPIEWCAISVSTAFLQTVSTLKLGCGAMQVGEDVVLPAAETAKAFQGS